MNLFQKTQKTFASVITVAVFCVDALGQEAIDEFSAPAPVAKSPMMWLGASAIIVAAIGFVAITKSKRTKDS